MHVANLSIGYLSDGVPKQVVMTPGFIFYILRDLPNTYGGDTDCGVMRITDVNGKKI
jgi:hypothetical protein